MKWRQLAPFGPFTRRERVILWLARWDARFVAAVERQAGADPATRRELRRRADLCERAGQRWYDALTATVPDPQLRVIP